MLFMQLFLTILSGMTNSADPDQTTPSGGSGSALFALVILLLHIHSVYKILRHSPYFFFQPDTNSTAISLFLPQK